MRSLLTISVLSLALAGCGSSTSTRSGTGPEVGGEAGATVLTSGTGGSVETGGGTGETGGTDAGGSGGSSGTEPTGGTGNDVATGGGAGEPATGGQAGDAAGGTGNVGGGCEPWDCTNIAIDLAGWDPESGEPVPEACGLVEDPCTGMMIECGGCSQLHRCGVGSITGPGMDFSDPIENICGFLCWVERNANMCGDWAPGQRYYWNCHSSYEEALVLPNEDECSGADGNYCCSEGEY